ncbi:MAG: hypothetical protein KME06_07700 [Kastovskya adunca ATA6-11-RM4]|jgi:hypothetical protein|nr:hypothetical protein [Kastovskya adunca ATA6-11-RM4]
MYKSVQLFKAPFFLAAIIIFFCWLILLASSGAFFDGYHFADDHEIAAMYHDLNANGSSLINTIVQWVKYDDLGGRFRPIYYIHRILQTKLFGFNLFIWSLYNFALAVFSTFLFFIFAQLLHFSFHISLLFAFLITLGSQSEVWWQLGPAETLGTFLLSVSLVFLVLSVKSSNSKFNWEILFLVFTVLLSLTKESFILILPALAFLKVWIFRKENNLPWKQAIQKNILITTFLSIIFTLEIIYIKYYVGTDFGYAGYEGFNYLNFSRTLDSINQQLFIWLILVGFILVFLEARIIKNHTYFYIIQNLYEVIILFSLILFPQVLLYSKSGISYSYRYLIPAVFGYAMLILFLVNFIKQNKIIHLLFSLIITINLCSQFHLAWHNSYIFSKAGETTTALLNTIEVNTKPLSKILIVADPINHQQWAISMKRYLAFIADRSNLYLSLYKNGSTTYDFLDPETVKSFYNYQTLSKIKDKKEIDCVVIPIDLNEKFLQDSTDWLVIDNFNSYTFRALTTPNSYFKFSIYCKK